jgi:hypothetical protein
MAAKGSVGFLPNGGGGWRCRWEIVNEKQTKRTITIADGATLSQALEEAHARAIADGFSEALQ